MIALRTEKETAEDHEKDNVYHDLEYQFRAVAD